MNSDKRLEKLIFEALKAENEIRPFLSDIRITVQDNIAIIEGYVDCYDLKHKVQIAASRVTGLLAVLEELEVAETVHVDTYWKPEEIAAWPFI